MELALSGRGVYLGITDKDKLLGQLEVLQTKEAQLQKKELFIMGGELYVFANPVSCVLPFFPHRENFPQESPTVFAGHDPARGSGREVLQISRIGSVGAEMFQFSRFGSSRVNNLPNLKQKSVKPHGSARVRSSFFQKYKVGSGRVRS